MRCLTVTGFRGKTQPLCRLRSDRPLVSRDPSTSRLPPACALGWRSDDSEEPFRGCMSPAAVVGQAGSHSGPHGKRDSSGVHGPIGPISDGNLPRHGIQLPVSIRSCSRASFNARTCNSTDDGAFDYLRSRTVRLLVSDERAVSAQTRR